MLNKNPVADHHFITQVFAIWGIFGIDVPPHRFSCPFQVTYPGMFSKAIISIGCSTEEVRHGYIYIHVYMYHVHIYIYTSHKALFAAFCFYPLDIV